MLRFIPKRTRRRGGCHAAVYGAWLPILALALTACHGSGPTAATTGTLLITLVQPPGTAATAVLAGPDDYASYAVPGVDTVTLLSVGTYTLEDATATATDPIVTPFYIGTIKGSPATLGEGDTAYMSVTFAVVAGSGRAWIGSTNGGSPITSGYTSTQLTTQAAASITASVAGAYDVFDAVSNLWVADSAGNTITEYLAASLAAGGTPSRGVTITSSGLSGPIGLVFDELGDLWVSNAGTNTVVEFSASQLASGGSVTPAVTLSGGALNGPGRIAFDVYGNLWVPNQGSNTVVEFTSSEYAASGAPTPAVTLSASDSSFLGPRAVAFDEQGNLWVANATGNTIVSIQYDQQQSSGSPTPSEILSIPSQYGGLADFAFDNSGDIWALGSASSTVIEYTAQQIALGAASQPSYTIQVPSMPVSLAFDPPPNGIPLPGPLNTAHRRPGLKSAQGASRVVRER